MALKLIIRTILFFIYYKIYTKYPQIKAVIVELLPLFIGYVIFTFLIESLFEAGLESYLNIFVK